MNRTCVIRYPSAVLLDRLPDASVHLVIFAPALEYLDNRTGALRELRRVLEPDGALVLSRMHPTGDWIRHCGNYFEPRPTELAAEIDRAKYDQLSSSPTGFLAIRAIPDPRWSRAAS